MKKKKMWRKKINSLFETLNLLNILYQLKQKQIPKIKTNEKVINGIKLLSLFSEEKGI